MADLNNPLSNQPYLALLSSIVENNQSALTMLEGVPVLTNLPTNAKRWSPTNARFEKWNGVSWAELTALFEMKVRNSDQLNGQAGAFYRSATNLNAGTLPAARFNDTAHGARAGGSLHAAATTVVNGFMSAADKSKLNAIESGATADMNSSEILAALLFVHGPGSGLNADLLDGLHGASYLKVLNNLSDINNALTARNNLGLGSLAILNQVPASSIGQAEVGANAIGQIELKDATGVVSMSGSTPVKLTMAGGQYGFYPQVKSGTINAAYEVNAAISQQNGTATTISYLTRIMLWCENAGVTISAQQRYFTATRPYDLGDGKVGLFIFALVDNTTGKVELVYTAPEAPWHYNGKTDIRGKLAKDGKKYRKRRDMSSVILTKEDAMTDSIKLAEYAAAFNAAPLVDELITQEIYQRDMVDIPHPFLGNDLTGKTVVMLDPVSDLNQELYAMCDEHDDFDLNGLLHDGYLTIGNSDIGRVSPNGVLVPSFKWKNTI